MVGFEKSDTLTTQEKLLAGCLAGCTTRFIVQPLDIMKLRLQLQKSRKNKSRTTYRTAAKIYTEEGVFAFWHGHVLGQVHTVLAVSSQFYVYELSTKYLMNKFDLSNSLLLKTFCGTLAGCISTTLVIPMEVIRVRQMLVREQYKGIIKGAKNVYKYGGLPAFYEGLGASLLQNGPQVGINFTIFATLQPFLLGFLQDCNQPGGCRISDARPEKLLLVTGIAGSTAGFMAKTITYPFDLAKRRLQVKTHKTSSKVETPSTSKNVIRCNTLGECLKNAYKKEGVKGLYRGWAITAYKAQLTSFIAFTSYEIVCFFIRELKPK